MGLKPPDLFRRFHPGRYFGGRDNTFWRMRINCTGCKTLAIGSNFFYERLRVFLGLECLGGTSIELMTSGDLAR